MTAVMATSALPLTVLRRGKVRDVYEVDEDRVLLIATDRVSAFDVVLDQAVPHKGAVLTQLTAWWLRQITGVKHHMISADADEIMAAVPALAEPDLRASLLGRAMLAWRADVYPIECVVRAYVSGSGWREYSSLGTLAHEPLPAGIRESERLDHPRFTPATKAESGHDENISRADALRRTGPVMTELERLSLRLFDFGSEVAAKGGLILADTKFEFGERNGQVILVDEVLTPDSSRFWARDAYRPGSTPPSYDKQPLRDYLEGLRRSGEWNGDAPAPHIPTDVITAMSQRYLEAFRRLTGEPLAAGDTK